jgi:hypothetical protein
MARIICWTYDLSARGDEMRIMRGLTAIPDPQGGAHKGRVFYFGYDCASRDSHNTAWIYRGTM